MDTKESDFETRYRDMHSSEFDELSASELIEPAQRASGLIRGSSNAVKLPNIAEKKIKDKAENTLIRAEIQQRKIRKRARLYSAPVALVLACGALYLIRGSLSGLVEGGGGGGDCWRGYWRRRGCAHVPAVSHDCAPLPQCKNGQRRQQFRRIGLVAIEYVISGGYRLPLSSRASCHRCRRVEPAGAGLSPLAERPSSRTRLYLDGVSDAPSGPSQTAKPG